MTESRLTQFRNGPHTFDVIDSGPLDGHPSCCSTVPPAASTWKVVAEHFHERGLRTSSPDQRGFSPRARPTSRFAYGMAALTSEKSWR